ncbi:MAG: hypothetical protein JW982_15120 [Spirochaetes bacterium]|nr:hypothetical protein [Spirochaetota bacterium]
MTKKHMSFEEISDQYDSIRDGSDFQNEHLSECAECLKELKVLSNCIGSLSGYKKIVIVDTDMFMSDVLSGCRKKRIKLLWSNSYYRHSFFAAAAVAAVILVVPFVTSNIPVRSDGVIAENTTELKETEIAVDSESTDEVIYFLKRNNFRIVSVENDRVIAESRYKDFLHLKNAVEGGVDNSLNFVSKSYLSMAGTASGNNMYIPGGDRVIRFSIIIK